MAEYRAKTGRFNLRIRVLRRLPGSKGANGEVGETWPDPGAGVAEYGAARVSMSAGETIVQGIRNSTGSMNLRIKGRAVPVDARDRVKVVSTGELFEVTGCYRDEAETVLTVERLRSQSVQQ